MEQGLLLRDRNSFLEENMNRCSLIPSGTLVWHHHGRVMMDSKKRKVPYDEVVGLCGTLASLNPNSSSLSSIDALEHCSSSQRFSLSALSSEQLVSRDRASCRAEEAAW